MESGAAGLGKAEYLKDGPDTRFIVPLLSAEQREMRVLYEQDYCSRGDMENRIKEQQLWLFADRTSTEFMRASQLRLWFSSVAYLLLEACDGWVWEAPNWRRHNAGRSG